MTILKNEKLDTLEGKTIKSIVKSNCNLIIVTFTDGSEYSFEAYVGIYSIPFLQVNILEEAF